VVSTVSAAGVSVGRGGVARRHVARAVLAVLLVILCNPVRLAKNQLPPRPAQVLYLVDCSRSMALDRPLSRLDQAKQAIYDVERRLSDHDRPRLLLYRFGQTLAAAASVPQLQAVEQATHLQAALEQMPSRFSQELPKAIVVFSDGTAETTSELDEIARGYARMGVPVHTFPLGDRGIRGDVAIEQLVVPRRVEPGTKVPIRTTIRSQGFRDQRVVVQVRSADNPQQPPLASLPLTLNDQPQAVELVVEVAARMGRLLLEATPLPGEAILENNRVPFHIGAGERKIRVLYMEGTTGNEYRWIHNALIEDPEIECVSLVVDQQYVARPRLMRVGDPYRGFPATREELFAFDVVICSDISQGAFTREQLEWTVELVANRGGGFVMIGGHTSFGSGNWDQTAWDKLIPVDMTGGTVGQGYYNDAFRVAIPAEAQSHAVWRLLDDPTQNLAALQKMPPFYGTNLIQRLKPAATLLGHTAAPLPGVGLMPVFAVESYGRGRTFAMATDSTAYWGHQFESQWGEGDNRYFRKFWRNVIRWLSDHSLAGSKRLTVETDKIIYRPGEPIDITAIAFDEAYRPTTDYQVAGVLKFAGGQTAASSDAAANGPRLNLNAMKAEQRYRGELITTLPITASTGDREFSTLHQAQLEFTAVQNQQPIASLKLDVQILEDSREMLHPQPNRETLETVARESGGRVLGNANDLLSVLSQYRATPGDVIVHKSPLWDRSLIWLLLLSLLGIEWSLRRRLGFG
jgi:uncharacterized membrane protein